MAAESCRKRLREEVSCAVCLDFFADPVTLDCGHNFCRACVAQCWGKSPSRAACPQCRERMQASRVKPNRQLANVVAIAKELSGFSRQESAVCERHEEPLKLFCQDDQALICVVCDRAKEHRAHRVLPVDEAAQQYQNQISRCLESLRKERENILLYKAENEKESQDQLERIKAEKEKTAGAFSQLRQFLEDQETLLLAQMEEVEIAGRRDKHQAGLSAELSSLDRLSSLDSLIRELKEKQQQQPTNELLQNIGSILERYKKESFENPGAFPVALKWRIHDFSDINPFLEAIMKRFQDTLISGLQLQEANVTLDPDTAHPQLVLSEDCKSVRWGEEQQDLPHSPKRFEGYPLVLGCEGFTTGRHFWEVTLGSEGNWLVGVARLSVRRKSNFTFGPEEGIWAVEKWEGEYWALEHSHDLRLSQSEAFNTIRVTLNCAGGRVAFFDADSGAQLYVFSGASFCGETLLPFFCVIGNANLTLPLPEPVQDCQASCS